MNYLLGIFAVLSFIILLGEGYLSGKWIALYFQRGIPLFKRKFSFVQAPEPRIVEYVLSSKFKLQSSDFRFLFPPVDFNVLNADEIAFREVDLRHKLFTYLPIMHGIIRTNRYNQTVIVTGYVNWFVLWLIATFFLVGSLIFFESFSLFLIILILFSLGLGISYGLQYSVYSKICYRLEQRYSVAQ